tara:strand:+ start:1645 stop:1854 length:210 start_codon:yes stop_codon:yes gene_type:complete
MKYENGIIITEYVINMKPIRERILAHTYSLRVMARDRIESAIIPDSPLMELALSTAIASPDVGIRTVVV